MTVRCMSRVHTLSFYLSAKLEGVIGSIEATAIVKNFINTLHGNVIPFPICLQDIMASMLLKTMQSCSVSPSWATRVGKRCLLSV